MKKTAKSIKKTTEHKYMQVKNSGKKKMCKRQRVV